MRVPPPRSCIALLCATFVACAPNPRPRIATSGAAVDRRAPGSGLSFHLTLLTPRSYAYGTRAVAVAFGPDTAPVAVRPEYLWVTSHGTSGLPNGGYYPVPDSGTLPIVVQVSDTSGTPVMQHVVGRVRLAIPLRVDWLWYADIRIERAHSPDDYLFSDPAVAFSATQLANGDSLFVRIGGRSRHAPNVIR